MGRIQIPGTDAPGMCAEEPASWCGWSPEGGREVGRDRCVAGKSQEKVGWGSPAGLAPCLFEKLCGESTAGDRHGPRAGLLGWGCWSVVRAIREWASCRASCRAQGVGEGGTRGGMACQALTPGSTELQGTGGQALLSTYPYVPSAASGGQCQVTGEE